MSLKDELRKEGFDVESDAFKRAERRMSNPSGCEHCGAGTKVGIVNEKTGRVSLACCKKDVSPKEKK